MLVRHWEHEKQENAQTRVGRHRHTHSAMNVSELAYVAEPLSAGSATMQRNAVLCNTEKEMSMTCLCGRASAGYAT